MILQNSSKQRLTSHYGPIFIALCLCAMPFVAHAQDIWQDVEETPSLRMADPDNVPRIYRTVRADIDALRDLLALAPMEEAGRMRPEHSGTVLELPMPDGSMQRFAIVESPVKAPRLAAKYPESRTYLGKSVDEPAVTTRFGLNALGFHAIILAPGSTIFISAYAAEVTDHYIVYHLRDMPVPPDFIGCFNTDDAGVPAIFKDLDFPAMRMTGDELRTYRLAVAATGEYTNQGIFGGNAAMALQGIETAINQVNALYEREFSIRLVLVDDNDLLIFTDPDTDPYFNVDSNACQSNFTTGDSIECLVDPVACLIGSRAQNQVTIDMIIGSDNYDIGHLFKGVSSGGGCASVAKVCNDADKARASSAITTGSASNILHVAHEIGHQFGARHTFNSSDTSGTTFTCGGQIVAGAAYEPGSGTTIMSYFNNCGPDNIGTERGAYFHTHSYTEIKEYSTNGEGNDCPVITPTGNTIPIVDAGSNYTIPINTPFTLTGSANDPDGDILTYCWEQYDLGEPSPPNVCDTDGPIFRSFGPVDSPSRTFPQWSDILNNTETLGEILPCVSRTLTFRLTVRDNRNGGGGVDFDVITLSVDEDYGPFVVTSFNSPGTVLCPGMHSATWDVANTGELSENVNIWLSYDRGDSFDHLLAENVPNNGLAEIDIPCQFSNMARIMIEAADNIFFDVNDADLTIGDNTPPSFTRPADITIFKDENCEHDASVAVTGDVSNVLDNCTDVPAVAFNDVVVDGACPGEEVIFRTWTVTDGCGNISEQLQTITVEDDMPPVIANVSASPNVLWPPNHTMRDVTISYDVEDNCSEVTKELSISCNEPINDTGDGNTEPDVEVVDAHHVRLRAERQGHGQGRIYTITITATDECGNASTDQVVVIVPHNQRQTMVAQHHGLLIEALPNPQQEGEAFRVTVTSDDHHSPIFLQVIDILGRVVEFHKVYNGDILRLGDKYPAGQYVLFAEQDEGRYGLERIVKME